ncbi:MAG TPA: hypothetical protein VK061_08090 [Bacillota bacterium]|nr:hypothetical protein [Bacillota bacterium]
MDKNGYIFFDTLISLVLVINFVFMMIPLINLINFERDFLQEKMNISSLLHDELQNIIMQENFNEDITIKKMRNEKEIFLKFSLFEKDYIKACATWISHQDRNEEVCLYGKN